MNDDIALNEQLQQAQRMFPYLMVKDVAQTYGVHRSTVLRWIEKGLPAQFATPEQLGQLIALGLLETTPTHGIYLIPRVANLDEEVKKAKSYPKGSTRPKRGKKTGAGSPVGDI